MIKMLKKLGPYKGKVLLILILVLCGVLADLNLPNLMSKIIDIGIPQGQNGDYSYIITSGLIMLGVAVISIIANILVGYLSARVSTSFGKDLRGEIYRKVESYSLAEVDHIGTASLITRSTNDVTQLQQFVVIMLRIILMAPIMFVGGLVMAYSKNPSVSNVLLISLPILILAVIFISKKALPLSKTMQKKIDRVNMVMREKLTGIRVIRAFDNDLHEQERFDKANVDLTRTATKMQRTMTLLMPVMMLLFNFTSIGIIWVSAGYINTGNMMVGDLIAVVQYVMQIMMSMTMVSMIFVMYPRASASSDRIFEVLNAEVTIHDNAPGKVVQTAEKGHLEFRNVSFIYPHAEEPAIKNVSFTANAGETVAIIGGTGTGKSTLLNLIPRFYDVTEGEILVDGVNVKDYNPKQLRDKLGYVPQKAMLFRGSIAENIAYGTKDADEARIRRAAEVAQSTDFIEQKENGYDFEIAQGATNVSGGQKQRLSIARAVARNPEIYLFDDSFSALDFKTDSSLRAALKAYTKDAMVLIVAQRISTIKNADLILVLEDGEVVGQGNHNELLENCEVYREIVLSQMSLEESR